MEQHDLVIIGGGPAGLTAGLYAARSRVDVMLLERLSPGGQVLNTHWVENWPGDVEGVSGFDLSDRLRQHALKFGLKIKNGEAAGLAVDGAYKTINTPNGEIRAKSVILCPGASPRKVGIPGEVELTGQGVSYCGTCDAPFYADVEVACIGGGNTAAEEALYLTKFASKVYLVHRRDQLRADGILVERVQANEKIKVLWSHVPLAVQGGPEGVKALRLKDLKAAKEVEVPVQGVFVFVGTEPNTKFLQDSLKMDEQGFIIVGPEQTTSLAGVFAAGDCCKKRLRQIVVAAGEGAVAAYSAQNYLEGFA